MRTRKFILPVLIMLFTAHTAFCQSEALKSVVNNLAFYKEKKDLKYLARAKKSVDSVIVTRRDSANLEKMIYRAIVNSSILYIDSLNKLHQSAAFLNQTTDLVDRLSADKKIFRYQPELEYAKHCLANVYIRQAFAYINNSDYNNALRLFIEAQKYSPSFMQLKEYIDAASNIYKALGDTAKALEIVKKGRRLLPKDRLLLLDEANIYNNKKDYRELAPIVPDLLDINPNNADIAFVAANCYDHLNQYDKAESLYLRAIELNSAAYDPIFNLGLLYLKQSEKKKHDSGEYVNRSAQWLEKA